MKQKNLKDWIPIKDIDYDGIIELKNHNFIKILKITPINYNLKSELEKKSILNSYKIFLKTCNFNIQILIQSKKEDLENHINKIKNYVHKKENQYLEKLSNEYIKYISELNISRKSSTKEFFIIIENKRKNKENNSSEDEILKNELKENYFKIKECLARCGNHANEISKKDEVIKILFSFLNTRKSLY